MKITSQLMSHILKKTQDPHEIAKFITNYQHIELKILNTKKDDEQARRDYEARSLGNKQIRKNIQEKCDHPIWTFFGDPSGGHDSYQGCDICGWEW